MEALQNFAPRGVAEQFGFCFAPRRPLAGWFLRACNGGGAAPATSRPRWEEYLEEGERASTPSFWVRFTTSANCSDSVRQSPTVGLEH